MFLCGVSLLGLQFRMLSSGSIRKEKGTGELYRGVAGAAEKFNILPSVSM